MIDTQTTPYDYGSVMHYPSNAFAIDASVPTIIPVWNTSAVMGQRIRLSPNDILGIQRYYGCVATATGSSLEQFLQSSWAVRFIYLLSVVFLMN